MSVIKKIADSVGEALREIYISENKNDVFIEWYIVPRSDVYNMKS